MSEIPTVVLTQSGAAFDFMDPQPQDIHIEDIAHALSNMCRYTGHCRQFYSVAQHCVLMSLEVREHIALPVLLHDASEAYLGDVATPLKMCLPHYRTIEARVERAIEKRFALQTATVANEIRMADRRMMATEVAFLMPAAAKEWEYIRGYAPLSRVIMPWSPKTAKDKFLERYEEITGDGS